MIFLFFILITLFYFTFFFLSFFFLPFLLSHVADRVLVLRLGVTPEPLRWESRVQDIGPPEASWLHVKSNGESSPGDLPSMLRPSSSQQPASYSTGHPMPNN